MIYPEYLKKGDTVGITCASGFMPKDKTNKCVETLMKWGFKVKLMPTVGGGKNYFSGTDEERLNDLQVLLEDENVKAILLGRGGFGLSRIIDNIDFKKFKKQPKWILGYSDVTILHSHINKNLNIATIHCPMAAAFNEGIDEYILSIKNILLSKKNNYKAEAHSFNSIGNVHAELVGGNLCMLTHSIGTKSCYNTKDKIVFIEDVGEYLYSTDRMLWQLKRAGFFNDIAGLIIGSFTDMKDTTLPYGKSIDEILKEHFANANYPIAFNFPVGHQQENYALKVGGMYELNVGGKGVSLKEV